MSVDNRLLFAFVVSVFLPSCSQAGDNADVQNSDVERLTEEFSGIPVDITVGELSSLDAQVVQGSTILEGDRYQSADIRTITGIEIHAVFDTNEDLYYMETSSDLASGPRGVRVGSTLRSVEEAWPDGELIFGVADRRFVRYLTDTNIVFTFNPSTLDPVCFENRIDRSECIDPDHLVVEKMVIYSEVVPVLDR